MYAMVRKFAVAAVIAPALLFSAGAAKAQDIVDTAIAAGSFKTLVAAVQAAGLVDTLKGKGPFTVFAPTDDAFAKLPKGTVENLLKPENRAQLRSILTYHVVPRAVPASRIVGAKSKQFGVKSVQGSMINVDTRRGVKVSGANVIQTDIRTSNGIIHVIDRVMLPPAPKAKKRVRKHH